MKTSPPSGFFLRFRSAIAATLVFASVSTSFAGEINPTSTLVITVEEQADGSVKFSATGTATAAFSGSFFTTPSDPNPSAPIPPHTLGTTFTSLPLPPGLVLTIEETGESEPEPGSAPEEADPGFIDLPVTAVHFSSGGDWALGEFGAPPSEEEGSVAENPASFVQGGDPITGSGSVTVNNIPFSNFVPGVYTITAGLSGSEPEPKAGGEQFGITYKVVPYKAPNAPPKLTVTPPTPFPPTEIGRRSRTQQVKIKNVGKVPVTGISVSIPGNEFIKVPSRVRGLNPGATASVGVFFRPGAKNERLSTFNVRSTAPAVSAPLSGTGIEPRPNSPRYPRGIFDRP